MKIILTSIFVLFAITSMANEPVRCTHQTRWGQCTNEAEEGNTLCVLHNKKSDTTTVPVQKSSTPARTPIRTTTETPKSSGQCIATTKKGTRCSRTAASGSNYCWQHR